jgi:hypothetical protein
MLRRALGVLTRAVALFYGVGAIGLAGAITLVAAQQPGPAGSPSRPAGRQVMEERLQPRTLAGPLDVIVMVRSDEQASSLSRDVGHISGYLGGVPSSIVVVESAREAELVRVLLKNDRNRLLIDFSDR